MNACWKEEGIFGDASCEKPADVSHCRNGCIVSGAGRNLLMRDIPKGFAEEWTGEYSQPKEQTATVLFATVVFRLAEEWFALKTDALEEVIPAVPVQWIPHRSGNGLRGLINVHGELVLCVDLSAIMGVKKSPDSVSLTAKQRFIVCRDLKNNRFSFAVDEILGIVQVEEAQLSSPPASIEKSQSTIVCQIIEVEETRVGLLDENRFFERVEVLVNANGKVTG